MIDFIVPRGSMRPRWEATITCLPVDALAISDDCRTAQPRQNHAAWGSSRLDRRL